MRYNIQAMHMIPLLSGVLFLASQSPVAQAPPVTPTPAAAPALATDDGPVDAVPATSKCASDRRLARTLRYAILPLDGEIGDETVTEALDEFLKRTPASASVNALVIRFNLTGGEQIDTLALAEQIQQIRKRMPVIGVFGSCVGTGAVLPLLCDYLVVLSPPSDGVILNWLPGSDVLDEDVSVKVGEFFNTFVARCPELGYMKDVVKALLDPTVDLYLWRAADGCARSGPVAPTGIAAVQLSNGKDALTGMSGEQLVTSGLALASVGGIDGIGNALGVTKWTEQSGVASKILAQIKSRKESDDAQTTLALKTGFTAVKNARSLVGGLIEAEANARATDPRTQQYRRTYSRSWSSNSNLGTNTSNWQFTRVASEAWRKNCDFSVQSWQVVVQLYDQASRATTQARVVAATLAKSDRMKTDVEFKSEVNALTSEVDAILAQAASLDVKGSNARQTIDWLQKHRNNPAM